MPMRQFPMTESEQAWRADVEALRAARPRHILFLCVANSARSQMAEGIARLLTPKEACVSFRRRRARRERDRAWSRRRKALNDHSTPTVTDRVAASRP